MRRPFGALMDKFDGVDTAVSDSTKVTNAGIVSSRIA